MMFDPRILAGVLAIAGGMFLTAAARAQTTWYVDNGNCPGPGSGSEGDPFCKIQDGIDESASGDEVIVADGTYTGDGNRDLDFGGRDIHLHSASLDPKLCIIDCQGSDANPHRGFYFHNDETSAAVVEGFTIRNGYANLDSPDLPRGGGIFGRDVSPTIKNCTLSNNTAYADDPGNYPAGGGGIYVAPGSPMIINCTITQNAALGGGADKSSGGGIILVGGGTIVGCTITENFAGGSFGGGGILAQISPKSSIVISDCDITDNVTLGSGGGILMSGVGDGTISNCLISQNHSGNLNYVYGGGGIDVVASHTTIENCVIVANTADRSGGGLIAVDATIVNCVIAGNFAQEKGGGVFLLGQDNTVINTLVIENTSSLDGGGAYCRGGATFVNCTIAGNTAAGYGGGIVAGPLDPDTVAVDNTILRNNAAPFGPELATFDILTVNHSDIEGGQAAVHVGVGGTLNWGPGNIDVDPLFVDADGPDDDPETWEDNDYRLQADSLCIDAADSWAVPPDIETDLDANPRFVDEPDTEDTGAGRCPFIDMGAFEYQEGVAGCCPADFDGDGEVGPFDLAFVLGFWGPNPGHPADLDGDGEVGPFDLALLLGSWGPCL